MKLILQMMMLLVLMAGCGDSTPPPPFVSGREGQKILPVNFLKSDSTYATVDTASAHPAILFYITTECPYCKAELSSLLKNADSLGNTHVYLLTNSKLAEIREYEKDFKLDQYRKNFTMGIDTGFVMIKYFGIHAVPYLAVYNKDQILKQAFNGSVSDKKLREVAAE
ncbi:MAG: redoxin domain-containing protein [Chitinophaga sp.]|uniref:TlpA family protein disulfide reductase n=1 Tax=Chitinophaga sp. TaxID=1869181 RepID=UPI0025C19EF0|nr:redoxin domain-containing protein [Chitinophaga sp.]MBV8255991.1 redoxin domain-containing protein [Chitinophaga sp.]